ncbi:Hypothetical_protein [Hexamita inflata]|uniref:Hypothetical_protein n=1 Tax=Hexamita inflata TaxID=28002 RepID=A0AA86R342_9EUKA|nr:Hypothetical protein HINF_LOCUS52539 [Hexamita inflata]
MKTCNELNNQQRTNVSKFDLATLLTALELEANKNSGNKDLIIKICDALKNIHAKEVIEYLNSKYNAIQSPEACIDMKSFLVQLKQNVHTKHHNNISKLLSNNLKFMQCTDFKTICQYSIEELIIKFDFNFIDGFFNNFLTITVQLIKNSSYRYFLIMKTFQNSPHRNQYINQEQIFFLILVMKQQNSFKVCKLIYQLITQNLRNIEYHLKDQIKGSRCKILLLLNTYQMC